MDNGGSLVCCIQVRMIRELLMQDMLQRIETLPSSLEIRILDKIGSGLFGVEELINKRVSLRSKCGKINIIGIVVGAELLGEAYGEELLGRESENLQVPRGCLPGISLSSKGPEGGSVPTPPPELGEKAIKNKKKWRNMN